MVGEAVLDGIVAEPCPGAGREQRVIGLTPVLVSQARRTATVTPVSGVARSLRPLPMQRTCAPASRTTSPWAGRSVRRCAARSGRRARAWRGHACRPTCPGWVRPAGPRSRRGEPGSVCARGAWPGWPGPAGSAARLGVVQCGVAEQRVDGGEAPVAGPHRVAPVSFQVVEEGGDQRRVQVGDVQRGGRLAGLGRRSRPAAGACPGNRRWCGSRPGAEQPLGEERLQRRRQRGHDSPARVRAGGDELHQLGDGGQVPVRFVGSHARGRWTALAAAAMSAPWRCQSMKVCTAKACLRS